MPALQTLRLFLHVLHWTDFIHWALLSNNLPAQTLLVHPVLIDNRPPLPMLPDLFPVTIWELRGHCGLQIRMSDEKKRDQYDIELGEKNGKVFDASTPQPQPRFTPAPSSALSNNPIIPILSYCASSMLTTVTNKYVLSGTDYNLNFFLLCVQVCLSRLQNRSLMGMLTRPSTGHYLCCCYSDMQVIRDYQLPGF